MTSRNEEPAERFSLVAGGPFHGLLQRLGLLGEDRLPRMKAAIGLALVAWLLPGVTASVQSLVDPSYTGWDYFSDLTVYARFLVAIAVMIATERHADGRLELLARQFERARIIRDDALPVLRTALARAVRLSGSTLVEGVLAVAALVWSGLTTWFAVEIAGKSWEGTFAQSGVDLSWAGEVVRFVSNPLFLFLVLRWLWRFVLWAQLLFRISRMPLELAPLHSDRAGGLGFLAIYPTIFNGFFFALSCVVASSLLKDLRLVEHSSRDVWMAIGGWLVICLVLALGPLLVFTRRLYLAREEALLEYGRLGNQHHLAFHRKWVTGDRSAEDLLGHPDVSSMADLNSSIEAIEEMHLVPVDREAVFGVLAAAGVPMLAVAGTQISLAELLKWIAGAIF